MIKLTFKDKSEYIIRRPGVGDQAIGALAADVSFQIANQNLTYSSEREREEFINKWYQVVSREEIVPKVQSTVRAAAEINYNQQQGIMLLLRGDLKKFNDYCSSVGMTEDQRQSCLKEVKLNEIS